MVRTDYSSFKWLQSFKDPEGQLARWLKILGEYQFTVEHCPGNKHSNADALSRIPCKQCGWQEELEKPPVKAVVMATEILPHNNSHEVWGWTPAWSPEELCTLQQADPGLYPAIQWLINDTVSVTFPHEGSHALQTLWIQRQRLVLKDGILHCKWEDVPGRGCQQHLQLILPQELIPTVLEALHSCPTAGHLGVTKTLQKVRSRFYWPGQHRDVEDWTCDSCASRKMLPRSRRALLQLHQPQAPLQRVAKLLRIQLKWFEFQIEFFEYLSNGSNLDSNASNPFRIVRLTGLVPRQFKCGNEAI